MTESTAAREAAATGTEKVTADEVLRVAELANFELTPDEVPRMQRDLNAVLGYIAQLNELDTEGVPPMAQVGEMLGGAAAGAAAAGDGPDLRPDTVLPSIDRAAVMAAAPETDGRFFKVPKVIER
jgi:aspartyl-tRNA(Asn)/glutamyl-tRNA(Gln) amidotransferase subunit C